MYVTELALKRDKAIRVFKQADREKNLMEQKKSARALGLCSGGLDSILSALVLRDQGIDVTWISFTTAFFSAEKARKASDMTGVPLMVRDISDVYLTMLRNPRLGYGRNMNPCPDCHALMFRLAGNIMTEEGFDFLFSGEVLGQRPMSQTRPALNYVAKNSGWDGLILRPLSGKLLEATKPEIAGLVDRERLLAFNGRSRKPQMALAAQYGIRDYPVPAGGCLLTDESFSHRLKDLFAYEADAPFKNRDLHLLKYGRHFRLDAKTKAIVGRTQEENPIVEGYFDPATDALIGLSDVPGPRVLVPYGGTAEGIRRAVDICAAYGKKIAEPSVMAWIRGPGEARQAVDVVQGDKRDFEEVRL